MKIQVLILLIHIPVQKLPAEMIINGYIHSYKLPIIIIRANNIFGTRQHPEKLLPGTFGHS